MRQLSLIGKVPQWVALYGVIFVVFMTTAGALHHSEPIKQARMERQVASFEIVEIEVTLTPEPNEFASSVSTSEAPEQSEATESSEIIEAESENEISATPTPEFREMLLDEAAATQAATPSSDVSE